MAEIQPTPSNDGRWISLDALRSFAMLLGIVFHISLSFMNEEIHWPIRDLRSNSGIDLFVSLSHAFRMQLFFLISGFFAARTLDRKGSMELVSSRARRIGIPLLIFSPLLYLVMQPIWGGEFPKTTENLASLLSFGDYPKHAFYHLWFLQYLLGLVAAKVLLDGISMRFKTADRLRELAHSLIKRGLSHRWPFLLLAVPSALFMLPMPHWTLDEPFGIVPKLWVFLYFALFFAAGGILWNYQSLLEPLRKNWLKLIIGGMLMGVVCLPFRAYDQTPTPAAMMPLKFLTVWLQANLSWGMSLGLTGLALAQVRKLPACVEHFSRASYWYYIAHLPLVLWLQLWVSRWEISLAAKFALMTLITLVVLELTYRTLVLMTPLRGLLVGEPRRIVGHGQAD